MPEVGIKSPQLEELESTGNPEREARIRELEKLRDGKSTKALEALHAAAQAVVDAHNDYVGVRNHAQTLVGRPGVRPGQVGFPINQGDWLDRVAKECQAITLTELQHNLPNLDSVG